VFIDFANSERQDVSAPRTSTFEGLDALSEFRDNLV
jgi:hypothetical protein